MRRRPQRPPGPVAAGFLTAMAVVVGLSGTSVLFLDGEEPPARGGSIRFVPPPVVPELPPAEVLPVFAVSDGVRLRMPSPEAVAVAFHEASYDDATGLRPTGVCEVCRNRWKYRPPPPRRADLAYIVTDTRGRTTPATSAVDVVLPAGAMVVSPVTGTVTGVRHYRLYRRYPDVRIEIRPDDALDRRVVMLHLAGVRLSVGDRVEASTTSIGAPRGFRFRSQVDRYVPGRHPHVHIEVKDPAQTRRAKTKR